ncbi:MAG: isoprenoid biosynthesis glyoxalase ElbB [Bdellovibrionota bacterium]
MPKPSKKIALILSGCGHRDGAEITEAVSLIISLGQSGAEVFCFAPDLDITPINHITGETKTLEKRNLLEESARIARGQVKCLEELNVKNFDGLALAGGTGAAIYLSNWSAKGAQAEVLPEIKRIITEFHQQEKPIGAVCIAPALVACVLGKKNITLTLGNDPEIISEVKKTGAQHVVCPVDDFITDRDQKIITSPAYMYKAQPHEVYKGISGLAAELVEMA